MTNDIREKIRQLLQYAELDTAFDHAHASIAVDKIENQNNFILLQAQWTEINALYGQGRLSFEEYFKEKNRITFAFLTFLEQIDVPSASKNVSLQSFVKTDEDYFDSVKKGLMDFSNGELPRFPKDPTEREYYSNAFAYMLYRTLKNLKK